jgi:cytochrome o ubiquinol oxidase operon protein cyoD
MSDPNKSRSREVLTYGIGYVAALALSAAAFAAVHWALFNTATTLAIVFGLALVQVVVHFRCFLHISLRRSSRDDLQLVLFSTLIVALMVAGTVVVLLNLRHRMM